MKTLKLLNATGQWRLNQDGLDKTSEWCLAVDDVRLEEDRAMLPMMCVKGDHLGVSSGYEAQSRSGMWAVNELAIAVGKWLALGVKTVIPVVRPGSIGYWVAHRGMIYTPVFEIVGWLSGGGDGGGGKHRKSAPMPASAGAPLRLVAS